MGCGVFKVIKSSKRRSNLGGGGILGKLRTKVPNPILGELERDILDYQVYPKLWIFDIFLILGQVLHHK